MSNLLSQRGNQGLPRNATHQQLIDAFNKVLTGNLNATFQFTLSTGSSTTLVDPRLGPGSHVSWMPLTTASASQMPNLWASNQSKGTITLNHLALSQTTQSFLMAVIGAAPVQQAATTIAPSPGFIGGPGGGGGNTGTTSSTSTLNDIGTVLDIQPLNIT